MFLQMAWRNIWRNPRRTAVIMTAVIIGVWSMIFLGSLMRGIADQMVRNGISTLTGHIQIHEKGYRADPVIENSITEPETIEAVLERTLPEGSLWTERVRVSAIISNARHSDGVTMVGVDPLRESRVSFIGRSVVEGRYLDPGDPVGVVIGRALAEKFDTELGRRVVLMSQDADRRITSRAFRIVGIFRAELEATEKQYVFVTLAASQEMLRMGKRISEVAIVLADRENVEPVSKALRAELPAQFEVHTWRELLPLVTAYLDIYDVFIYLWFLVVFIAMAFGIVNTTLMAVFERMREFGLFKSIGMKPPWIIGEVLMESTCILLIGTAAGNVLGLLSVYALSRTGVDLSALAAGSEYFGISRVIYPVLSMGDVVVANGVVFVLGLLVSLYPALKAARFTPVEALART